MKKLNIIQKILIKAIKVYQKILSPDHSFWAKSMDKTPYCKHIPSCSEYTIEAIEKKWSIKWSLKWFYRIIRCNPWNKWWYDPVEKESKK